MTKTNQLQIDPKEVNAYLSPMLQEIRNQLTKANNNLAARHEFIDALDHGEPGVSKLLTTWGDDAPVIANAVAEDFLAIAYELRSASETAEALAEQLCRFVR